MALAVVVSLFASYIVAMTVVPLFCARYLRAIRHAAREDAGDSRLRTGQALAGAPASTAPSMHGSSACWRRTKRWCTACCAAPATVLALFFVAFAASLLLYRLLGLLVLSADRRRSIRHYLQSAVGNRLTVTENEVAKLESLIKEIVPPDDLGTIVDNIGVDNGFSAVYTSNAAMHTGFISGGSAARPSHRQLRVHSPAQGRMRQEMPELTPFFSTGSLVDAVVSMGAPAPIDVQIVGANLEADNRIAQDIAGKLRLSRRSPTSSFRRISTIRRCASTSTACTPPSSG